MPAKKTDNTEKTLDNLKHSTLKAEEIIYNVLRKLETMYGVAVESVDIQTAINIGDKRSQVTSVSLSVKL